MDKEDKADAQKPTSWKCSFCEMESSPGCSVMDQNPPRKMCTECMADCVQTMLALGYFEMNDDERMNITGFITRDIRTVLCEILNKEQGGYAVRIVSTGELALLITQDQFEKGEKISTLSVCRSDGRLLLQALQGRHTSL